MMNEEELTDYEAERAARIAANRARLAALGVLDAAAGLQAASNPAPQNVPQRRKREKRPKTEEEENLLPRRASGRIAAAGGTRNYNEKSFYSFSSYSPLGEKSAASSSSRAPKGPPRVPSSCHSCRQKRDEMGGPAAEGSNCWRCDGARGRFCRGCLSMRYGLSVEAIKLANEKAEEELLARRGKEEEKETEGEEGDEERALSGAASADNEEGKEEEKEEEKDDDEGGGKSAAPPISSSLPSPCGWLCPHCYEEVFGASHGWICNSSLCLKKRPVPIQPTGVAVFESRAAGHASVAHALQAKLTENGRLNGGMVGPRKEGLGCVVEGLTDLASVERRRAEAKEEERRKRAAADAADAAAGGVAPSSSSSPPPAAGKENDSGGNAAAKRPRGRPPKSAGGGGGGARAATAEKEEEEQVAPRPLPLAASAALPQPAA